MTSVVSGGGAVDMALNHGTACSERCLEVLRRYQSTAALRGYTPAGNDDLREAIAAADGVPAESVLVANGSGPLLKTCIPFLIEKQIKRSLSRVARYLLKLRAYPIVTPRLTYSKVPSSAMRMGLRCELLPLSPANGFALDLDHLASTLRRCDGLVYLSNPNNPTGNVLVTRPQIDALAARFPGSIFFIDEAYVHYLEDPRAASAVELPARRPNVVVTRSLSFAHGLAAARVGYAVADPALVAAMDAKLTPYRIGQLATDLAIASLADDAHLGRVRRAVERERARLFDGLSRHEHFEVFDSVANFILCRAREPWSGRAVHDELLARGVRVKWFEPVGAERFDEYFRVTVGLPAENSLVLEQLNVAMDSKRRARAAA